MIEIRQIVHAVTVHQHENVVSVVTQENVIEVAEIGRPGRDGADGGGDGSSLDISAVRKIGTLRAFG